MHEIEEVAERYGLTLNRSRCEALITNPAATERMNFKDGKAINQKSEAKYLGCKLNTKADIEKEITMRLAQCNTLWKRQEKNETQHHYKKNKTPCVRRSN